MNRILNCPSLIISRSSRSILPIFKYNDYALKREYHFKVLSLQGISILKSGNKFSPYANFHTSSAFSSAADDSPQRQSEVDVEKDEARAPENRSQDGGGEGIIERLRRLSMTPAHEYQASPMAEKKAREMAKSRGASREWEWDQRNLRPGGPPQQNQYNNRNSGYNRPASRNWHDEDDYDDRSNRRPQRHSPSQNWDDDYDVDRYSKRQLRNSPSRNWNDEDDYDDRYSNRRPQRSYNEDRGGFRRDSRNTSQYDTEDYVDNSPESYEVEMQKLRERMNAVKEQKKEKEAEARERNKQKSEEAPGTSLAAYAHYISSGRNHTLAPSSSYIEDDEDDENSVDFKVNLDNAANNPDTFGNLTVGSTSLLVKDTVSLAIQAELQEEEKTLSTSEEEDDTRFTPEYKERWTSRKLIRKVRELLEEQKLKEAIDTFLGALKEGGFDFDHKEIQHHFNVLIHACSLVGYVEMAFRLFAEMKSRGYKVKDRTYSSLLNACANSPWEKENNLDRIEKLLIAIKEKGETLNLINYHALIKAYGRLGETLRAFAVVDEMINEASIKPTIETFNMLFQACITDTKNGFRHALITWQKLQTMKKARPDIFTFNLLLKAVKDCEIEFEVDKRKRTEKSREGQATLLPPIVTEIDSKRFLSCLLDPNSSQETHLVLENFGEEEIIDLKSLNIALKRPENRLAVFGGIRGIISKMVRCKVGPNLKTVTQLLECSRPTELLDVVHILKAYKIKADQDFYNVAIARCHKINQDVMAMEFLKLMVADNITPNIVTFGALALGCRSWPDAQTLLKEMDDTKFTPNIRVMDSFLKAAKEKYDPKYVLHIMEEVRKREIPTSPNFLSELQKFLERVQRGLISKEMGKPVEPKPLQEALQNNPALPEHFALFKMRLKTWVNVVDVKVEPENPWKEEFEHFKKERRHRSHNEEVDVDKLLEETEEPSKISN